MQKNTENAIEYLRRIVSNLNFELEELLSDLPSIDAIIEYFELWSKYDTDFAEGIIECLENGESPKEWNDFVNKYNLDWDKF